MIDIKGLGIDFKMESIYKDFSLTIKKGEKLAIIGESGKGKSTLLNLMAGFIPDFEGQIDINGTQLNTKTASTIRKDIAWLPQETNLNFKNVTDLIFAPFEFKTNKKLKPSMNQVEKTLNELELPKNILSKAIKEISGGQKQRVAIASCLLLNKPLMLLDEPTSALDQSIKKSVTDYILSQKDLTVVSVTHDDYWIKRSDRILHLK